MNMRDAKKRLLNNKRVRDAFSKEDVETLKIDIGLQILELRIMHGLTQERLAQLIGTEQPSIARAERGAVMPSITLLYKIATALKTRLIPPRFESVVVNELRYHSIPAPVKNENFNFPQNVLNRASRAVLGNERAENSTNSLALAT